MLLNVEERHNARQEDAVRTVWWEAGAVCLIDQTKLPQAQVVVRCSTVAEVAAAIRSMVVRGAPAIGVTAAYGMALAALMSIADDLLDELAEAKTGRDAARTTAVNLGWATERMLGVARRNHADAMVSDVAVRILEEAHVIRDED